MQITNVLLVDDDPSIMMIAETSLKQVGKWNVTTANSGAKALEIGVNCQPDVILLDVMMPGMDGPATFRRLRQYEHLSDTPVIFVTAKVHQNEVESYRALGAAGVITKPFDPLTLPSDIEKLVKQTQKLHTPGESIQQAAERSA